MRVVVVESPCKSKSAHELARNLAYVRALCRYVLDRGDVPIASHLDITQILDDRDPAARDKGIAAGLARLRMADVHMFGVDLGWSDDMHWARRSTPGRCSVEHVSLPEWAEAIRIDDSDCNAYEVSKLVGKYQPLWHVHE